jgi:hypothetical protein
MPATAEGAGLVRQTTSAEERKDERRRVNLVVEIEVVGAENITGRVSDISRGGARLKIGKSDKLPELFLLRFSDNVCRWSRTVWRGAEEIGVEFVPFPQASTDGTPRHSVYVKCPTTGKKIPTGITLWAGADVSKLPDTQRYIQCPYCHIVHGWKASGAQFETIKRNRLGRAAPANHWQK